MQIPLAVRMMCAALIVAIMVPLLQATDERGSNVTSAMPHMGILLFGDSVDYRVPRFLCNIALGLDAEPFNRDRAPDPYHLAGAL